MTLDSPRARLESGPDRTSADPHALERDTLPWTGVSVLLAVLGLLLFLAVPERPWTPDELEDQRVSAQVMLAYGRMRAAIEDYRADHGRPPGIGPSGEASVRELRRQLLLSTDAEGHAVPQALASHPFGPYLSGDLPANPINGRADVRLVDGPRALALGGGDSGWLYHPASGELALNAAGVWGAYRGEDLRP